MRRPTALPLEPLAYELQMLVRDFPNFRRVTETVVAVHAGMLMRGLKHRMPPILLLGPPGVGKSVYAEALAEFFNAPLLRLDFASETNASALVGSSTFWANSSPGGLFNMLAWGDGNRAAAANPIVYIDEVDKSSVRLEFNPLQALLGLLEPKNAKNFADQSVPGLAVDASHVRWILTANDAENLADPLMSRMVVFQIERPTREQAMHIAQSIVRATIRDLALDGFDGRLTKTILQECAEMSPREVRIRIEIAIGLAITNNLDRVTYEVWSRSALSELIAQGKQKIGFV